MNFDDDLKTKRTAGGRLLTLTIFYNAKYNPMLDGVVCEGIVINQLVKLGFPVNKKEILNCFKKLYNKEFHGNSHIYLKWLYSLGTPLEKTPSFHKQNQANNSHNQILREKLNNYTL